MGSFSIALTGLRAQSQALNTIGNNLANLNTTAYKDQQTTFADLFYHGTGMNPSGDPLQTGLGVRVASTDSDFSQGTMQTTGNSTDLAIQGNGFFVLNSNGQQLLTRDGNFQLSAQGQLQTTDGVPVMGYAPISGSSAGSGPLAAINLPIGSTQPAKPSSQFTMQANLNASAAIGTNYSSAVPVYDSLGTSHAATVTFTKTANNQWSYSIALPAGDAASSTNNTGTLTFDTSGNLISPTASATGISFGGLTDGAANMSLKWNLFDASGNGTISQTNATSAVAASSQDGYASGAYNGFTIGNDGSVSAQYTNGETAVVGTVAMATVENVQGLSRTGDNSYAATSASGVATVGASDSGGRGSLEDDALEGSNVDISTEFSNLIVAQRAYEANSKTVTTFDTITQETINLIR